MIVKRLIEKNLELFENTGSFMSFYKAHALARMHKKFRMKESVEQDAVIIKALRGFYYGQELDSAVQYLVGYEQTSTYKKEVREIHKEEKEYFQVFLNKKIREEDYKIVLEVLAQLSN